MEDSQPTVVWGVGWGHVLRINGCQNPEMRACTGAVKHALGEENLGSFGTWNMREVEEDYEGGKI